MLLLLAAGALAVIFRYGPNRARPHWRWISWGSAFAALAWLAASLLFSWYAAHFGSFNKTYGSLGAVIGFMTWMWISVIVIVIGARLNAVIEQHAEAEASAAADLFSASGPRTRTQRIIVPAGPTPPARPVFQSGVGEPDARDFVGLG